MSIFNALCNKSSVWYFGDKNFVGGMKTKHPLPSSSLILPLLPSSSLFFPHPPSFSLILPPLPSSSLFFPHPPSSSLILPLLPPHSQCASVAAHYELREVFDNLVISLCKFTTLLNTHEVTMATSHYQQITCLYQKMILYQSVWKHVVT